MKPRAVVTAPRAAEQIALRNLKRARTIGVAVDVARAARRYAEAREAFREACPGCVRTLAWTAYV